MAFNPPTTEVMVFDTREAIERLLVDVRAAFAKLIRIYDAPLGRGLIRLKRGAETLHALDVHVMQIVRDNNAAWDRDRLDRYTYGAPALMLFHADRWAVGVQENAMLSATYAMLAAHASGLGTTMLSILGPALNNFPENRRKWGIADDHRVYVAMILGYPKYTTRGQNLRQEPLGGMGKPEDRPAPGNRKACPCEVYKYAKVIKRELAGVRYV